MYREFESILRLILPEIGGSFISSRSLRLKCKPRITDEETSSTVQSLLDQVYTQTQIYVTLIKSRYFDRHPGPFKSVTEVCFVFDNLECHMRNCVRYSFI